MLLKSILRYRSSHVPSYEELHTQYSEQALLVRKEVLREFREEMRGGFKQRNISPEAYLEAMAGMPDAEIRKLIPEDLSHLTADEYRSLIRWVADDDKEGSALLNLSLPYHDCQNECFRYARATGMLDRLEKSQITLEIAIRVELIYYLMEQRSRSLPAS